MKRDRRHELHTNILAQWVSQAIEAFKPRANVILSLALLVIVVIGGVVLWRRHAASGAEQAWDAYNRAVSLGPGATDFNPGTFEKLVEEYPGSDMVPWAAVTAADLFLQQGCELILRDKGAANQQLQKAVENYSLVLSLSQLDVLREQATFGLARAYEALSGTRRAENELQKAIESYESVVKNWPNGAYTGMASQRLEQLRLPETKRFYDKLAQYDPKSVFADTPGAAGKDLGLGTVPAEPGKKPGATAPGKSGASDFKLVVPTSKPPAVQKTSPPPVKPEKASEPPPAPKTGPASSAAKPAEPAPAKAEKPAPAKAAEPAPAKTEKPAPAKAK